ncbi:minichromosome maintenance-related protein [Mactra antiquata]
MTEMQAMAERMKQLEKLLHQSQSSPAVSSPKLELREKRKSTSPNIKSTSLNRKSDSPNIKSESSKRKSTSPKIKCTSSNRTSTSPSERTVNKSKCSFNDKGTSSLPGQTGSTHKNEIRSSTCDKLTVKSDSRSKPMLSLHKKYDDNLNTKKSPKLKSTTNGYDDDNPFFTNDKSTSVSGTTDNDDVINSRSIFGESDDSDWEDLAGEEKHELSKEGKDIKKLIVQGQKKRQAHTPSYDTNLLKKPDLTKWSGNVLYSLVIVTSA